MSLKRGLMGVLKGLYRDILGFRVLGSINRHIRVILGTIIGIMENEM